MQNKTFRLGPVALTTTLTTNILNPPTASGGVNGGSSSQVIFLSHIRVTNKTVTAATFTLYLGATGANAAGTELAVAKSVPPNDWVDMYFTKPLRIDAADFLVGGAGTTLALVLTAEGEIGVTG